MPRTRTFLAVDIGPEIRGAAVSLQESLSRSGAEVKWVTPENMHVTLVFLGEVDDRDLHSVCRAARKAAAAHHAFMLHVTGVGAFPTPRRPKILWAGITEGADQLRQLQADLETRMLELGCNCQEERGYNPHLTLGRVKSEADGFALVPQIATHATWDAGQVTVDEVLVFSSVLERDGPVYTILGRAPLQASRDE